MSKPIFYMTCILVTFLSACQSDPACESGKCKPKDIQYVETESSLLSNRLFVEDELASKAFIEVNELLTSNSHFELTLYQMTKEDVSQLLSDAQATYHLSSSSVHQTDKSIFAHGNTFECSWNLNSIYEFCYDMDRFESSPGIDKSLVKSDEFYLDIANHLLTNNIHLNPPKNYVFYPYKRKYGINGSAPIDKPDEITETIYDVGVSFASTLDGWPVIGPGGKIYMHFTPDGDLLATKVYRKRPDTPIATLSNKDLKTADEALLEIVNDRGYKLDDYIITRAEFGYFYWGKNSIQNILSPSYVFFFAPAHSENTTEVFEIVSAVKGQYAALIQEDYQLEINRKQNQLHHTAPDIEKLHP